MEDAHREGQLLFPAQRQRGHQVVGVRGEVQALQQRGCLRAYLRIFHTIDACEEAYVFGHREVFVEREALRHITYVALYLFILRAYVEAADAPRAARGLVQARKHMHGRRLARTVSAEETEYFAPLHGERYIVYGTERSESLHQVRHFDYVVCLGAGC